MEQKWQKRLNQALALLEAGEIAGGLEGLEELKEEYSGNTELEMQLVTIYHELGHHETALAILDKLEAQCGGQSEEAWHEIAVYRASLYIDLDRLQEAMDILLAIKEGGTDDYRVYALLGEVFLLEGLEEVAIRYLERAAELAPDNEEVQYLLGKLYAEQGESGRAMEKWQALKRFEDDAAILLERARMAARQGEFETALALYEKAAESEEVPEALYGAGMIAYQTGNWQRAVRSLARLIEVDPDYVVAYPLLAEALWKLNMREQALVIYERALALHVEEEELLCGYLRLVVTMEEWARAENALSRLYKLDEEAAAYWYWRGRVAEAKGDKEEALLSYERVLSTEDEFWDTRQRYEGLRQQINGQ
ncbi:tetratricopeptide repeat protein [Aneurinibacillus thermoaerophilus]|uniref:Tetratricopeptide repeat protein n=1 Tax=Aneurinibacillus thermoaerophilus TaxID=143495 RepID=A0ABX8YEV3_ANETH|nr:tetratricopeptide repeat protein [Aneurinibacillus thermoaerophilus]QYY43870.1 tetratricopeptide repeat protein [Aneurinibacillus thermoaerophilus]